MQLRAWLLGLDQFDDLRGGLERFQPENQRLYLRAAKSSRACSSPIGQRRGRRDFGIRGGRANDLWPLNAGQGSHPGDWLPFLAPRTADLHSKMPACQSGRRDLNPRPLDPSEGAKRSGTSNTLCTVQDVRERCRRAPAHRRVVLRWFPGARPLSRALRRLSTARTAASLRQRGDPEMRDIRYRFSLFPGRSRRSTCGSGTCWSAPRPRGRSSPSTG